MLATAEILDETVQLERLATVLPRFLRQTPLYRTASPTSPEPVSHEVLRTMGRLPFITKQDIRKGFPGNFLADGVDLETLVEKEVVEVEHTSGTSEARIPLLLPKGWWGRQELQALRLNPFVAGILSAAQEARRVTLSSPVCSGEICYTGVPSLDERTLGLTRFLSLSRYPFLLSRADFERMVAETLEWKPVFLDVDPVYGMAFARYCEQQGIKFPTLKFIICTYEFVSVCHRRMLQRAFGVPVFNLYGSTETGHLLMEDESGHMRPSLETAFLEVPAVDSCGIGELVVTTLTNDFMPLIRYRIGDLVERSQTPYGSRYIVHGRVKDAFRLQSGKRVTTWQIDQCFAGVAGFAHYQIIQRGMERWELRFIPDASGPDNQVLQELTGRLSQLLEAKAPIDFQATDMLVPERSGKFRLGYPAT